MGTKPIVTKDTKVASAVLKAVFTSWFSLDRSLKKFDEAMENPSAKTLEIPSIKTIAGESAAPAMPDTMAKVVTVPSIDPYTNSGKYFLKFIFLLLCSLLRSFKFIIFWVFARILKLVYHISMEDLHVIVTIGSIYFLSAITPGPNFFVAVKNSVNYGRITGVFTAFGFALGVCVHLLMYYFGISLFIGSSPVLYDVVKFVGAGYLLYFAVHIFLHRKLEEGGSNNQNPLNEDKINLYNYLWAVKSGFLTCVLNPKIILFFIAIFTTSAPSNFSTHSLLITSGLLFLIEFGWFSLVAIFFTQKQSLLFFNKYSEIINIFLAMILVFLALKTLFF